MVEQVWSIGQSRSVSTDWLNQVWSIGQSRSVSTDWSNQIWSIGQSRSVSAEWSNQSGQLVSQGLSVLNGRISLVNWSVKVCQC